MKLAVSLNYIKRYASRGASSRHLVNKTIRLKKKLQKLGLRNKTFAFDFIGWMHTRKKVNLTYLHLSPLLLS